MLRNVIRARERDLTAQMFRWCCAAAHLRENTGVHCGRPHGAATSKFFLCASNASFGFRPVVCRNTAPGTNIFAPGLVSNAAASDFLNANIADRRKNWNASTGAWNVPSWSCRSTKWNTRSSCKSRPGSTTCDCRSRPRSTSICTSSTSESKRELLVSSTFLLLLQFFNPRHHYVLSRR